MSYRVLRSSDAHWRPSNQMQVQNTDLASQLGSEKLGARLWRLEPGQANTLHRHFDEDEIYVLLEGTGRLRIDDEVLTLEKMDAVFVQPEALRQVFNDTDASQLWLMFGGPKGISNTLEMTDEQLAALYPNGPRALPPELGGGEFTPNT